MNGSGIMSGWLKPEWVFDGQSIIAGAAIQIEDGVVRDVKTSFKGGDVSRLDGGISLGFVDIQVNGGGGVFFNTNPTPEGLRTILAAHRAFGTVGVLPTVITDAPDVMTQAVETVLACKDMAGVLGIHIEGPHISVARRGTHATKYIRPMDDGTIGHVERLRAHNVPVMITVAPESTTSDQIARLHAMGAVVSIGHSDASYEETQKAIEAGVTCATHLFNGMPPMLNRAPGVVGAILNSNAAAGIIPDGHHVADGLLAIAMRAKARSDQIFLVSDAMPTVGGPDHFQLYDMKMRLHEGRLVNSEGSLAGAHISQAEGAYRLIGTVGLDAATVLRAAISVPARLMGVNSYASLSGYPAKNLVSLNNAFQFERFVFE